MFTRKSLAAAAALLLLAAGPATAQETPPPIGGDTPATEAATPKIFPYEVHTRTLDNGLDVVAVPYDSPGVVAYFTVVRTGSREEVEPGHSGFAHFFEHMMFRGTERYPADEYNDVLRRMGADSNAFTTDDYTNYYIVGPSSALETLVDVEADRFQNLEYTEDAFRTEALAVLGEYNKNVSSPFLPMYERMRELAFQEHTYRHTTMGFLEDIKAMPGYYDYSLSFFDRFYRPENVVVLVVGDVDPQQVFALAKKHYGDWERGYQAAAIEVEPEPEEGKRDHLSWPSPTRPYLMMGYRTPAFDAASSDTAALDVLAELLFSEASPLYQELVVEKQWVDQLAGSLPPRRDPYLFTITARAKSADLLPRVEEAITDALAGLQEKPVDPERLERVKSHMRYDFALDMNSAPAVAFAAAQMINLTGRVEPLNTLYRAYDGVTPEDVQRVAKQYFQPRRRTLVTLSHEAPPEPAATGDEAGTDASTEEVSR